MSRDHLLRAANVSLRALTLVSKFALLFLLAKFLEPREVGMFGLLAATIGYALYVVGFEFYTYSTRAIIGANPGERLGLVKNQAAFHVATYVVALPLLLLVFWLGWLPWRYCVWLMVLLVLEHAAQELNRILIATSRPLMASTVLFLRSGAWCWVVGLGIWLQPSWRHIEFVLGAWAASGLLACALALTALLRFERTSTRRPVNWRWVAAGLKVAAPLFLASLSVRGVFTLDRYWIESAGGLEVLGAYVLFIGMATAVLSFLDAAVVDFAYPHLVAAAKNQDRVAFGKGMESLRRHVAVTTIVLIAACWLLSELILNWLQNPVYVRHASVLPWLLLAVAIYAISTIPHLGLYAHGKDRPIVLSQATAFLVFVACAVTVGPRADAVTVAKTLCLAFTVVLLWKGAAYLHFSRGRNLHPHMPDATRSAPTK